MRFPRVREFDEPNYVHERRIVAYCERCGEPIREWDDYAVSDTGNMLCEDCKEELECCDS